MPAQVRDFDARFLSWAAWHYNPSGVDWNDEDASLVTAEGGERDFLFPLIRPWARAVAGRPTFCRFDPAAHRFNFRYAPDATCEGPTEIVIPHRCFHSGASIVVEGAAWREFTTAWWEQHRDAELRISDLVEILPHVHSSRPWSTASSPVRTTLS